MSGNKSSSRLYKYLALGQAVYYIATGVWGLVDIRSFQAVTGPKVDTWLVKTVSALVIAIGGALGLAGRSGRSGSPEIVLLAAGSAAGLAGVDLYYVAKKRISPVYLLDALGELFFTVGWLIAFFTKKPDRPG